jgi:autotransporter-associated beta strand protein
MSLSLTFWLAIFAAFPLTAVTQTLTISNGVQTFSALTNTTVTMTGHCELHLTAMTNPMPGCTLNLNSPDSWIFLPNIPPSVVSSSYLGQVLVNGTTAVAGGNCQLTECAMGSVVIPQSPSFTPLQIFSGPNFVGAAAQFSVYTYYNTVAALGAMYQNIGSFILKRGYMATFAQYANGTGRSQVYVAQDSDLYLGVMVTNLYHNCSFVRVLPWRYTAKKGFGGSSLITNTSPLWTYDWGNSSSSTPNIEYVPMKWSSSSGTSSINNKQNVTEVLGYNEPDSTSQANMTVAQAIADWPNMMQWGLRAGAPAVSDSGVTGQGLDWLYSFMSQANSLGYRVDFIPIHYYKCGWSTAQFSNYLAQIYQTTGKPLWITEWNNGANWCSSGLPGSQTAEATAISGDIAMLESAPFVERYAIYQWFDPSTYLNLINTNSPYALTPAGVVYANQQSGVAYTQTVPPGGSRGIAEFQFQNNTLDSSGYANNGLAIGDPNYVAGQVGQAIALDGTNSFIRLPPTLAQSSAFTFAAWVYWNGGANGQHIFDFGNDAVHYLYLSPNWTSGIMHFAINNGGGEQSINAPQLAANTWVHVAVTLGGGNAVLYTNGVLAASSSSFTISPASIGPDLNYLGKSQSSANPLFSGDLDEVQIADTAFTPAQIASLMTNSPPQFSTNLIFGGSATQTMAYAGSLAGVATDANPGDTLTYSKISGPTWLNVAADGTLTGTPTPADAGTNYFTVQVTDGAGATAFAEVIINTIAFSANGVWDVDASGNWSDTNNWSGGAVGNGAGYTADFSTVNITAGRTVTLDISRSVGILKFGEPSGSQVWTLASSNDSTLTLTMGTGNSPTVLVSQNTATIAAPLAGTAGLTKSGAGTLTLAGTNTYSGTTVISAGTLNFSSATQTVAGIISGSGALAQSSGAFTLSANNTYTGGTTVNGGTMNLAVGGSTGTIRSNLTINAGATVNLTAGDALGYPPGAIVTGINIVGGTLTNGSGGNEAFTTTFDLTGGTINSGGGYFNLDGANAAINSLATNVVSTISAPMGLRASGLVISTAAGTVPGGVDLNISGAMADLQGSGYSWIKSGAGTLLLSGVNTNTGPVTISAGTLLIGGVGKLGNGSYAANVINNGLFNYNSSAAQTLSGVISGTGALTESGPGPLTLADANTYSGNTLIAGGMLVLAAGGSVANTRSISISNSATLNAVSSGFTLGSAQTLTGNGTVVGNLTVNGTLAPGGNLSILTCNNNVTLQAGSTNVLELNPALGTNDQLLVGGTLVCAGTLVITKLLGTLGAGNSFKLFSAASYSGGFTTFNLPPLGTGLGWITTNLILNGTLSVIATASPRFSSVTQRSDGNFQFSGTGAAGVTYDLEATTNLAPPIVWQFAANTVADQSGLFQFVDLQATNFSQRFYCILALQ